MWILQELRECIIDLVGDDAREPFGFAPEVFAGHADNGEEEVLGEAVAP